MIRLFAGRGAALALGTIVALTLGLTGCAKKIASVDPRYDWPEGTPSPKALLVVTKDEPVEFNIFVDKKNDGYTLDDSADVTNPHLIYAVGPGAVNGTVFDSTVASAYQVLRREANGGYRIAQDFSQRPLHKWLDTEWEAYTFADPNPSGFQPPTYLGRGILSGAVTTRSPLTNAAQASSGGIANIKFDYQGLLNLADQQARILTYNPADSANIQLGWTQVPGAAGYWISIYQFAGSSIEFLNSALPAPIPLTKSRHYLLAYVPAPATSYVAYPTDGDTTHLILTSHPILNKQYYRLRITAVGAFGEIRGYTRGDTLDNGSFKLAGPSTTVDGSPRNTTVVMLPSSIALRPGPQVALAPQEIADSIRGVPARPGTALLRSIGQSP